MEWQELNRGLEDEWNPDAPSRKAITTHPLSPVWIKDGQGIEGVRVHAILVQLYHVDEIDWFPFHVAVDTFQMHLNKRQWISSCIRNLGPRYRGW